MARHRAIDLMRSHPSGFLSSLAKSLEEVCTQGHAGRLWREENLLSRYAPGRLRPLMK